MSRAPASPGTRREACGTVASTVIAEPATAERAAQASATERAAQASATTKPLSLDMQFGELLEAVAGLHELLMQLLELARTKVTAMRAADVDAMRQCAAQECGVLERLFEQELVRVDRTITSKLSANLELRREIKQRGGRGLSDGTGSSYDVLGLAAAAGWGLRFSAGSTLDGEVEYRQQEDSVPGRV